MSGPLIPGVPNSRKTPGFFFNVIFGGSPSSAANAAIKLLLVGNKITSALTGSAPTFTVDAGTMSDAAPTPAYSADEAALYAGRGSELHRMAQRGFEMYPDAEVTLLATAESAGAKASAVLTFVTTATGATTLRLVLCGVIVDTAVASGDTPTAIATNVAANINAVTDLPYTAQFLLGVLTLTAKHPGPRGNDLVVRAQWISSSNTATEITTSSSPSGVGTTATVSGVTTVESTYFLSGGTTADTVTAALAAIASAKYGRQAWAHHDATALDAIAAQLATQAGPTVQLRQQFVSCTPASLGTAITLATGRNVPRGSMLWIYNSPMPPPDAAAQEAAARINGDVTTGVTNPLPGEGTDPASNLIGLELKSIAAQYFQSEQPTSAEIESALNNGLTPLAPSLVNAGKTAVVRSITMRSLASGQPNYAVLDTCYVTAPDFIADDLQGYFAVRYRGCKLGPNSASGEGPKIANVVTPDMIRADVIAKLYGYEAQGITINVAAHVDEVIVAANLSVPGRVDMSIPAAIIPPFAIGGVNLLQLTQ